MKYTLSRSLALGFAVVWAGAVSAQDVTGAGAIPGTAVRQVGRLTTTRPPAPVNYQSVGSGAGIKQIEAKTVDFGASDMPLKDEDLAKGLMQFPTVIGGVIPVVNIKGITPGPAEADRPGAGDIYLGKITKWNDPAIKALNPGWRCPMPPSPRCAAPTVRAPASCSPTTCPR